MADQKISDFDAYGDVADTVSSVDLLPIVNVSGSQTLKIPLDDIVKGGGLTNQVLAKASGDDYDTQWVDPVEATQMAHFVYTESDGVQPAAYVLNRNAIPFNTTKKNTISGLTLVGGQLRFAGDALSSTYQINVSIPVRDVNRGRLWMYDVTNAADLHGGPAIYQLYPNWQDNATLMCFLDVGALLNLYEVQLNMSVAGTSNLLLDDAETAGDENYGEIMIIKLP